MHISQINCSQFSSSAFRLTVVRMRSRLGIVSILLLLTSPCFSTRCRTCRNEECSKTDTLVISCNKNVPILPFQVARHKNKEFLRYGCLHLDYLNGKTVDTVQQCILTENINEFCRNIAKSVTVIRCSVDLPIQNRIKKDINYEVLNLVEFETTSDIAYSTQSDRSGTTFAPNILNDGTISEIDNIIINSETVKVDEDLPTTQAKAFTNLDESGSSSLTESIDFITSKAAFSSIAPNVYTARSCIDLTTSTSLRKSKDDFTTNESNTPYEFSSKSSSNMEDLSTIQVATTISEQSKLVEDATTNISKTYGDLIPTEDSLDADGLEGSGQSEPTDLPTTEVTSSYTVTNLITDNTYLTTVLPNDSTSIGNTNTINTNKDLTTNEPTTLYVFSNSGLNSKDMTTPQVSNQFSRKPQFVEDSTIISETTSAYYTELTTAATNPSNADDLEGSSQGESIELTTTQRDLDSRQTETDLATELPYGSANSNEDLTTGELTTAFEFNNSGLIIESTDSTTTETMYNKASSVDSDMTSNCKDLTTNEPTTEYSNMDMNREDTTTTQLANPSIENSESKEYSTTTTLNWESLIEHKEVTTTEADDFYDSGLAETTDSLVLTPEPINPNSASKFKSLFIIYVPIILLSLFNLKLQ